MADQYESNNSMVVIGYMVFTMWGFLLGMFAGWLLF